MYLLTHSTLCVLLTTHHTPRSVAVGLAFALAKMGGRVGVYDADIYGPSLPSLVKAPEGTIPIRTVPGSKLLAPAEAHGVKMMSYG